jgi:hypothetical protein
MNQGQAIHIVNQLLPEISRTRDPETVLTKYASENNLAPAQLERLGQVFNTAKTISYMEKSASRGGSFSLVDVDLMVGKFMQLDVPVPELEKQASAEKLQVALKPFKIPGLWNFDKQAKATPTTKVDPVVQGFQTKIARDNARNEHQEEMDFCEGLIQLKSALFEDIHQGISKIAQAIYDRAPNTFAALERDSMASPERNTNALEQVAQHMDNEYRSAYIRADLTKLASTRVVTDTTGLLKDLEKLEDDIQMYDKTRTIMMEKVAVKKENLKKKKEVKSFADLPDSEPAEPEEEEFSLEQETPENSYRPSEPSPRPTPEDLRAAIEAANSGDDEDQGELPLDYPSMRTSYEDAFVKMLERESQGNAGPSYSVSGELAGTDDPTYTSKDDLGHKPTKTMNEDLGPDAWEAETARAQFNRDLAETEKAQQAESHHELIHRMKLALPPSPAKGKEGTPPAAKHPGIDKGFELYDQGHALAKSVIDPAFKDRVVRLKEKLFNTPTHNIRALNRDNTRNDVSRAVILQKAIMNDDVLSSSDPERVASLYNTLYKANPEMMSDPNVMIAALREAVQYDGVMPHTYDQFVSTGLNSAKREEVMPKIRSTKYSI